MNPKPSPRDSKKDKSIAELEADLAKLQLEITMQTQDIKQKFKRKTQGTDPSTEKDASYTLEAAQAEFFATIATLDTLILNFQQKRFDSLIYNHQLKGVLQDLLKMKYVLEQYGISTVEFLKEEKIFQKFPHAIQQLEALGIIPQIKK
jgi:molecular chaperone GrpE (heat shock protein)